MLPFIIELYNVAVGSGGIGVSVGGDTVDDVALAFGSGVAVPPVDGVALAFGSGVAELEAENARLIAEVKRLQSIIDEEWL